MVVRKKKIGAHRWPRKHIVQQTLLFNYCLFFCTSQVQSVDLLDLHDQRLSRGANPGAGRAHSDYENLSFFHSPMDALVYYILS